MVCERCVGAISPNVRNKLTGRHIDSFVLVVFGFMYY